MAGTITSPGLKIVSSSNRLLEAEAEPELSLERDAYRFGESGCAEEIDRLLEVRTSNRSVKRVTEVGCVEQIECLKEEAQVHVLAELEVLCDSQIHLSEF